MVAPLFVPSISLLIGVILSLFLEPNSLIYFLAILGVILLCERNGDRWTVIRWNGMVLIFGFCWGIIRTESEPLLEMNQYIRIIGEIRGDVKRTAVAQSFDFIEVQEEKLDQSPERAFLVTTPDRREFQVGDRLEIRGRVTPFQEPRNPGEWNEKESNFIRGVEARLNGEEIHFLENQPSFVLGNLFLSLREKGKEYLKAGNFGTLEEQALIQGIVIGDASALSPQLKEEFRSTGTGHIFAVSGQNLGVILMLMIIAMSYLRINRWRWGWMALLPLFIYSGVSGFQSSCIRAWIMLAFVLVAWRIDRPTAWLNFWSATVMIILLWNPRFIQDLGFQLSFLVVLGLIVITPWGVNQWSDYWKWEPFLSKTDSTPLQRVAYFIRKEGVSMVISSGVAFCMVLPHSFFLFHQVNFGSVILNLFVVPLAGFIVMGGSISLLVGGIHLWLSASVNFFLVVLAKFILVLVHSTALMTWLQIPVCDFREWRWSREPQLLILDLGEVPQGIIRYRGKIWLINTGNKNQYERKLRSVLKYYGVSTIEGVLATTVSESSNGGLMTLLQEYRVKRVIRPEIRSRSPLENQWDRCKESSSFERWNGGGNWVVDREFQIKERAGKESVNKTTTEDQALLFTIEFQGKRVLWGSRISESREKEFIKEEEEKEEIEVLVHGRNPRDKNLCGEWLDFVNPRFLILSPSGRRIQKTGYDRDWNLRARTQAKVILIEKTGALILEWGEKISIRSWRDSLKER